MTPLPMVVTYHDSTTIATVDANCKLTLHPDWTAEEVIIYIARIFNAPRQELATYEVQSASTPQDVESHMH